MKERVLLNIPYIPCLSCYCCSNPATRSRRQFRLCHWRHCVRITLWAWWQELKTITHTPLSCQRCHPLQSSRSGSLAHGRTHLPGQQCPQLQDLPRHNHLALDTYSSDFWVTEEYQVLRCHQSGHDNTVSLLKTGTTCASARDCADCVSPWVVLQPHRCHFQPEWHSEAVAFPLHVGLDALLLPYSPEFSCPL